MLPDCGDQELAKQGFDIHMDDSEQGDKDSGPRKDGSALEDVCDVDTSTLKSDLHFLLDFSTGSSAQPGCWWCLESPSLHSTPIVKTHKGEKQSHDNLYRCPWRVGEWNGFFNEMSSLTMLNPYSVPYAGRFISPFSI